MYGYEFLEICSCDVTVAAVGVIEQANFNEILLLGAPMWQPTFSMFLFLEAV